MPYSLPQGRMSTSGTLEEITVTLSHSDAITLYDRADTLGVTARGLAYFYVREGLGQNPDPGEVPNNPRQLRLDQDHFRTSFTFKIPWADYAALRALGNPAIVAMGFISDALAVP